MNILVSILAVLYIIFVLIKLRKIADPRLGKDKIKHYPRQHEPLGNISPAASQIIITQSPSFPINLLSGTVMDWALKDLVTLEPIDDTFSFKNNEIADILVLKKDNPAKMDSLKNWEKDLYQDLFKTKNSFQTSDLFNIDNTSSTDVANFTKQVGNYIKYSKLPDQIIKEELAHLTLTKKEMTGQNIIWLILPFVQIPLFLALIILSAILGTPIFPLAVNAFALIVISTPLLCLISLCITFSKIFFAGLYLNTDGKAAQKYLLGLITYIKTAEKDRILFHAKDKSLSELTLLPYAVGFGIIEPLINFDTEPSVVDDFEYRVPSLSLKNKKRIVILMLGFMFTFFILFIILSQ
jgi:hypothetical protein